MDVPRLHHPRRRRAALVASALGALAALTVGVRWLAHRPPVVARDQLWIATVERGPLALSVRGQGTLVPTELRWASAPVAARVERVRVQPGATVDADSVLLDLVDPATELAAATADRDVAQAEAELARLAAQLDGARLAPLQGLAVQRCRFALPLAHHSCVQQQGTITVAPGHADQRLADRRLDAQFFPQFAHQSVGR